MANPFPAPSASWQNSNIWGSNGIGSFSKSRDAIGVRDSNDGFSVGASGSSALASTEAGTWGSRAGTWNSTDSTQARNVSGHPSPNRTRSEVSMHEFPNYLTGTQRAVGGSKQATALDSTNGTYKYSTQFSDFADDKDGINSFGGDAEQSHARLVQQPAQEQPFLRGGHGRDSNGDDDMHGSANSFADFSFGNSQVPVHTQRPSLNGPSGSFHAQNRSYDNGMRKQASEDEVSDQLGRMAIGGGLNGTSSGLQSYGNGAQDFQLNPGSQVWDHGQSFNPDGVSYERRASQVDRSSPAGSTYRAGNGAGLNSPRSFAGTPQPGPDSWPRPVSRDHRLAPDNDRRGFQQSVAPQQSFYTPNAYYNGGYPQFAPGPYDSIYGNVRQPMPYHNYQLPVAQYPFGPGGVPPVRPSRDDPVRGLRSVKLEEFRSSSKSSKRYELKDIYGHIVEFSGDQHGSRFIQTKLETANSDDKEQVFTEILPNAVVLMKDLFGNYVIQKFFEHGNQVQKQALAAKMKGKVVELSTQMYACRVVQKALSCVLVGQQAELVSELEPEVLQIVKDQNGNHVIQKILQAVLREHTGFIFDCFKGRVSELSQHTYGCRVIQRALEWGSEADKAAIMKELHSCAPLLITDQYGNYVTQHVITDGSDEDRARMVDLVMSQLPMLSKHKFASNVVEKCIDHGTLEQQRKIRDRFLERGEDGNVFLVSLIKDQFGNYVLQTLINTLQGQDKDILVNEVKPLLASCKKACQGKQIAAIDRLTSAINCVTPSSTAPTSPGLHVDINSQAPTPSLTMGPNSPSSSQPSTSDSTIEDTVHADTKVTVADITLNLDPQTGQS
ncbi:putative pumilio protein [Podospora australis]|uniref:Pumilio protein n=1 Tax=Podospora australis TaxID=1536484 RepID=A0AAN7AM20_9PEZI|nr:putative pumilio protein [Podospora australis]